ncbi:MAG: hypothetical protein IJH65_05745 [Methanobrevibacter sp.]|nr:hypothetical protein [Methanobrevibacter sp.]
MNKRFGLSPSGMFVRDYKHRESYGDIDEIIALMNKVNESDNCAVDIIEKELAEQEDENVKIALKKILYSISKINTQD